MSAARAVSRRKFLQSAALASAASVIPGLPKSALAFPASAIDPIQSAPLDEFGYGEVTLNSALHEQQLQHTQAVLMDLGDDALLKPFRQMVGQPAPGEDLGGWYRYDPNYDWHTFDAGFAPSGDLWAVGFGAGEGICDHGIAGHARQSAAAEPVVCADD